MPNRAQLIRREDFVSVQIQVMIRNNTSGTLIEDLHSIQLLETHDDHVALAIPRTSCAIRHELELKFIVKNLSKEAFEIKLHGKVTEAEWTSETHDRILVKLRDSKNRAWKDFLKTFSDIQKKVDEFLVAARGY